MRPGRHVREALLAFLAGVGLTLVMKWQVVRDLRTGVPVDLGDPLLQAWQLAWGGHAVLTQPTRLFEANTFAPLRRSLAFSDSLLGYFPFGLVGDGVDAAITRYNLVFLFAHALAFAGTYVLARQLGVGWRAAAIAGAAYAFSPFRVSQESHLQVLSTGGIPLCLAMLARGHGIGLRSRDDAAPRWAFAGWLVAAWQVSLGFGAGLQLVYLLAVLVGAFLVRCLVTRTRPSEDLIAANALGGAVFFAVGVLMAAPYLQVVQEHPEARRDLVQVAFFSPPLRSFAVAPPESRVWGERTADRREGLTWRFEQSLAPGLTITALAVLGLAWGPVGWRRRLALAGGVVVVCTLALGTHGPLGGRGGFLLLFEHAPGWQGIRTPSRLVTVAWLLLALLGAYGAERLLRGARRPGVATGAAAVVTALVLAEGLSATRTAVPAPAPVRLADLPQPVLVLPSSELPDNTVMLWSTDGFPRVVNGASGFRPARLTSIREASASFPDPAAVGALRAYGVRSVVLLREALPGTPLEGALQRPLDPMSGLEIDPRTADSSAVVYYLRP